MTRAQATAALLDLGGRLAAAVVAIPHPARYLALDYQRTCVAFKSRSRHKPLPSPDNPRLAPRERKVAELALMGRSDKEIASHLGISPGTVKNYMRTIRLKCGVTA